MVRPDRSGIVSCRYDCDDCDFEGDAKNGVGLAAQHKEAYPDHTVRVEQVTTMTWD